MVESSGVRWESEGVVVPVIGVRQNASGGKGPHFDRVCGGDVLREAWRRVLRDRGAAGVDRIALERVQEYGVGWMLDELACDLREGVYRPAPVRRVEIPKPDGGRRPLGILRGWGNYFRTGNAAIKFTQVDDYVVWRLRRLMIMKRGRTLRAGQAQRWTENWFNGLGPYRLRGTIRYPKAA